MRGYAFSELSFVQIRNGRRYHIAVPGNSTNVLIACAIADDEAGLWRILFGNQSAIKGSRSTIRPDATPNRRNEFRRIAPHVGRHVPGCIHLLTHQAIPDFDISLQLLIFCQL